MVTLGEMQKLQSYIPLEEVSGTPHKHRTLGVRLKGIGLCLLSSSLPYLQTTKQQRLKGKGRKSRTRGHTFFIFDKFSGEFYSNVNITIIFVLSSENECCCLFILSHLIFFFFLL